MNELASKGQKIGMRDGSCYTSPQQAKVVTNNSMPLQGKLFEIGACLGTIANPVLGPDGKPATRIAKVILKGAVAF